MIKELTLRSNRYYVPYQYTKRDFVCSNIFTSARVFGFINSSFFNEGITLISYSFNSCKPARAVDIAI